MVVRFILTDYVNSLMAHAVYEKLDDGTYAGRILQCKGVIAEIDLNKVPAYEPVEAM